MFEKKYPKVLVISNNCFSLTDSNGRTLGNFLNGWPKQNLAQFYIQNSYPSFDVCENFFRVTDAQALSALKTGKSSGGRIGYSEKNNTVCNANSFKSKKSRNALTMIARNIVWQSGAWQKCGFWQWVGNFSPDVVLLQAGDCAFMFRLAEKISKKYNAKLLIYNSEGYYFKKFDYFKGNGIAKLVYPIFRIDLRKALRKAYRTAEHIFYTCDELEKAYDKDFKVPSSTLYTSSSIEPKKNVTYNPRCIVSYCGNLGIGRHQGLIEIANALQDISEDLFVDVYGGIPNQEVADEFENCKGIRFHGRVPYEQVKDILYSSDIILHVESFDTFYKEDLKFAFSTKIADSLSCGTCFLIYAPESLACSRYLIENEAAYVVSKREELHLVLEAVVRDSNCRQKYIGNALKIAQQNHQLDKNCEIFQKTLKSMYLKQGGKFLI